MSDIDPDARRIDVEINAIAERLSTAETSRRRASVQRMLDGNSALPETQWCTFEDEDEEGAWEQPILYPRPGGVCICHLPSANFTKR